MSDRFFHDGPLGVGDAILAGPEAHHLATVRRIGPGDSVTLFNGDGSEYAARIVEVGKKRVVAQVFGVEAPDRELGFVLHIASAMPKGDRGDFLTEKLTELGVTHFTPLITERSVVRPGDSKTEKLIRAVIEASKQCGRNVLMQIEPPALWIDWCLRPKGRRLMALPSATRGIAPSSDDLHVAIGPEGGFTEAEVNAGLAAGWESVSLGPRVLRVETAALVAATLVGRSGQ